MTKTNSTRLLIGDIILVDNRLFIKADTTLKTHGLFYPLLNTEDDQKGLIPKGELIELTFSEPVAVLTRQDKIDLRDVLLRGLTASSLP